jgi:hypothetical protein
VVYTDGQVERIGEGVMADGSGSSGRAVVTAVLAAFFGVRGRADAPGRPIHVVVAGVLLAAVFVLTLIAVVQAVLALAGR